MNTAIYRALDDDALAALAALANPTALADALTQAKARFADWAALAMRLAAQHSAGP